MEHNEKQSHKGALFVAFGALMAFAAQFFVLSPKARENREKAKQFLLSAREEVTRRIGQLQGIDEDTFRRIADEVTERYAKLQNITPRMAAKLGRELKKDWKEIHEEVLTRRSR